VCLRQREREGGGREVVCEREEKTGKESASVNV
jgi:hypothetical protein